LRRVSTLRGRRHGGRRWHLIPIALWRALRRILAISLWRIVALRCTLRQVIASIVRRGRHLRGRWLNIHRLGRGLLGRRRDRWHGLG
jgi:hypothetical protein